MQAVLINRVVPFMESPADNKEFVFMVKHMF